MAVIGVDLGGTKIRAALVTPDGTLLHEDNVLIGGKSGKEVGMLLSGRIQRLMQLSGGAVDAIGVSAPGIYDADRGTVWAPNLAGWEEYPLYREIRSAVKSETVTIAIENDRACYIAGESRLGAAQGYRNAVFIAVGTGIGAGVMVDGAIVRGSAGSAGSIGWLPVERPYNISFTHCGCLEYLASGEGIARMARRLVGEAPGYHGSLRIADMSALTARDVFNAYEKNDPIAGAIITSCIELWGMAAAALVSLLDPDVLVFGGGVFGPAAAFLDRIHKEAEKWGQPVAMQRVIFAASQLGENAGLIGAACFAYRALGQDTD